MPITYHLIRRGWKPPYVCGIDPNDVQFAVYLTRYLKDTDNWSGEACQDCIEQITPLELLQHTDL